MYFKMGGNVVLDFINKIIYCLGSDLIPGYYMDKLSIWHSHPAFITV